MDVLKIDKMVTNIPLVDEKNILEIEKYSTDPFVLSYAYGTIAHSYGVAGNSQRALEYVSKARVLLNPTDPEDSILLAYIDIEAAYAYELCNDLLDAIDSLIEYEQLIPKSYFSVNIGVLVDLNHTAVRLGEKRLSRQLMNEISLKICTKPLFYRFCQF